MPLEAAWAGLAALLLLTRAAAQDAYTGQTAVGQLPNDAMAYFAGWPNPCLQPNASSGKVPAPTQALVELAMLAGAVSRDPPAGRRSAHG